MDYCDPTDKYREYLVNRGERLNRTMNRKSHRTLGLSFDLVNFMGTNDPAYTEVMKTCKDYLPALIGTSLCNARLTEQWFNEAIYMRLGFEGVDSDNVELYNLIAGFIKRRVQVCQSVMPTAGDCFFEKVFVHDTCVILVVRYFPHSDTTFNLN